MTQETNENIFSFSDEERAMLLKLVKSEERTWRHRVGYFTSEITGAHTSDEYLAKCRANRDIARDLILRLR